MPRCYRPPQLVRGQRLCDDEPDTPSVWGIVIIQTFVHILKRFQGPRLEPSVYETEESLGMFLCP